jgi:hypothetical protein
VCVVCLPTDAGTGLWGLGGANLCRGNIVVGIAGEAYKAIGQKFGQDCETNVHWEDS